MPNKNIPALPAGTFAAGHLFEMYNTAAAQNQQVTIPGQSVQTQNLSNVTLSGNTAGVLANISSGAMTIAGGNNITLSQAGNAFTISGVNTVAQSVQTQNCVDLSLSGNTAGVLALISSGTGILAGGNNITLSQNGQSITISGPSAVAAGSQSFGMSNIGNTSGTTGVASASVLQFVMAGGNNITLSQSLNAGSGTITISAFNQSVQALGTASLGMSNLGNTSGTTGVATGTSPLLVLAGGNNVTLSQSLNGASATITISAFTQTVQTQSLGSDTLGMSNVGNTSGTTGVVSGSGVQLILAGGNNITLSQSVNGSSATVTISAFTQSVQTQSLGSDTLGMSNVGNTSGTTGVVSGSGVQLILAGGNNITLSQSINGSTATITISAFTQSVQTQSLGSDTLGMSNVGNTSGTTGVISSSGNQLILAGGNNITLSQSINGNSATITISAAAAGAAGSDTVGMSNIGNTSGTTGVVSSSAVQLILAGGNNVTLSQSINGASATITISAGTIAAPTLSWWNNMGINSNQQPLASIAFSYDTIGVYPLNDQAVFPGNMTANTVELFFTLSGSTATMSQSFTSSVFLGIYTLNASSLSLLNSVVTSFGSGAANANLSTIRVGGRFLTIHSSAWSSQPVFTQGHYWVGLLVRSSNVSDNTAAYWGQNDWAENSVLSGSIGISQVNATTVGFKPFRGIYSVSSGSLPTVISSNAINKQVVAMSLIPVIRFNNLIQSY